MTPTLAPAIKLLLLSCSLTLPLLAAEPFSEGVRSTEHRSPAEEQKSFKLPPGFEIQLVAAEPDIAKPMNLAFDAKGRIWVTVSEEYPYPAKNRTGRDAIKVLEDTNGDGRADKITTFAEGLNIPIGIYPYKNGCIAFSIPHIYHFQDTDNDGKADKQDILYGPLGFERDTHGMNNSFRRGYDGWLYIAHGFNNESTVRGRDGSQIKMVSGNTYRVTLDGERVEQWTYGQVNPYGLCFDPLGNLFSADCHSSPLYQLLRAGNYPSFGKAPEGLGFAPVMVRHNHGSTAIAGIANYADDQFPPEYRNNFFVGNVMTSRLNRDIVEQKGSTYVGKEVPDLVETEDPWFRPVDTQLGPDGALYIADFYNRIIGHYEVPLDHPGRDRSSGRIWRISYKGTNAPRPRLDLSTASAKQLVEALGDANLTYRMLATQELVDRVGPAAEKAVERAVKGRNSNPFQKAHGLWVLHRLGKLDRKVLLKAGQDESSLVRTHAMKVLSDIKQWDAPSRDLVVRTLKDQDGFVKRASAEALMLHPAREQIQPLLQASLSAPAEDSHLIYMLKMAIRDQLQEKESFEMIEALTLSPAEKNVILDVALDVKSQEAGSYLIRNSVFLEKTKASLGKSLKHVYRYAPVSELDKVSSLVQEKFKNDPDFQFDLYLAAQQGLEQRGEKPSAALINGGKSLARSLIDSVSEEALSWGNTPLEGATQTLNPWNVHKRPAADGKEGQFFTSLQSPAGEAGTGILRSESFKVPANLSFFLAGHRGNPEKPAHDKNVVRLKDATTDEVLVQAFPPRNDLAQEVRWDLSAHAGRTVYLEIVDGDTTPSGFAWLAVGRFEPDVLKVPSVAPSALGTRLQNASALALKLKLNELEAPLARLLSAKSTDADARAAIAKTLVSMNAQKHLGAISALLSDSSLPIPVREKLALALSESDSSKAQNILVENFKTASSKFQQKLAQVLANKKPGAELVLNLVEKGQVSPRVLLDRGVRDRVKFYVPEAIDRVNKLTSGLPPVNEDLQKLVDTRRVNYSPSKSQAALGAQVFLQNCAACHQVGGNGGLVGPQLDGIATRGLDRIIEDIVDPNRNVDHAFRTSYVTLTNDEVFTGLFRREEGEVVIFADATGKEISIPKKEIKKRAESESSLMPEGFGEGLSAEDFNHLVSFLLSKGAAQTAAQK